MKIESNERGFEYGVRHVRSDEPVSLEMLLKQSLGLSLEKIQSLSAFGAIYINSERHLVPPQSPLPSGTLVRIHTKPRRYPLERLNLGQVLYEETDFLVFNKPSGVPVHASVDNFHENVLGFLTRTGRQVLTTHRLDVATSGLLVIAKTLEFQKYFNQLLAGSSLQKTYRALSHGGPLRLGVWTHYMEPSPRAPKKIWRDFQENFLRCDLEILESKPQGEFAESRIRLLTGRTHQIRTQLGFEGSAIVGDRMYGSPLKLDEAEAICLQACELSFPDPAGKKLTFTLSELPDFYQKQVTKDQS